LGKRPFSDKEKEMTDLITVDSSIGKIYFNKTPMGEAMVREVFSDNYKILSKGLTFEPGDVILDIGACEGMFSIMMAKLYPFSRVVSLEPVPQTFYSLIRNIGLNGATNIEPYNVGVGKETGSIPMFACKENMAGGSSAVMTFNPEQHTQINVDVLSLDDVFEKYHLSKVKLLKMDIEGLEYDVIYASKLLHRVENFVGEFHINKKLKDKGRDITELATWVGSKTNLMYYEPCYMAE